MFVGGVIEIKANMQNISIYKQMNKVSLAARPIIESGYEQH